ncbi:MAG: MFS transporter, partial [Deltaproteobacteria bacterium]|nr:MFS transporter [Deltaproteobacteria bacterium]
GPRLLYGWWIVITSCVLGVMSSSARFSCTRFFPSLIEDLEWTRARLAFGFTVSGWVSAITALMAGPVVDRYGPRLVMTLGGFLTLVGLVLTSRMSNVKEFYIYFGIILAVGGGLAHGVPAASTVRKWFSRRAGLAVSISSVGGGMGLGAIALVAPWLIKVLGWRGSWFYLGLVLGAGIMLISFLVIRKDPESMGLLPDGVQKPSNDPAAGPAAPVASVLEWEDWTVREAFRTRSYWCLVAGHAIISIPLMGALTHMAIWGVDIIHALGIPVEAGMGKIQFSIFASAMAAVIGAFLGGALSDRVGRKPVFTASFILYGASMIYGAVITQAVPSLAGVIIFNISAGFFYGLGMSLWTVYVGDIFGRAALGTLYGLLFFIGGVVGGSGAVLYGFMRDLTGSYVLAFTLGAVCSLATLILTLLTGMEKKRTAS